MKKSYLSLMIASTLAVSGCIGPFKLTHKVLRWNSSVGSGQNGKWINEGVFLVFIIVPVYGATILVDGIVLNSIEWWGGKNPVDARNIKSIQSGEEQAVLNYTPDTHRLRVDSFRKGRRVGTVIFEPGAEGMVAHDEKGQTLMTARTVDDQVVLADASGKEVGRYDATKIPTR